MRRGEPLEDPRCTPGAISPAVTQANLTKLHTAVCKGQVALAAAQQAIVTDWTTALATLHLG
ncbi:MULTISPECIES: hypothetical protein [Streptomyces]|uniref:Uncharacterized protein n=1 Tax=Streptomyces sp. 900129855 TaxID=3155129 RepID=A0ABV2ZJL3_9ACTN